MNLLWVKCWKQGLVYSVWMVRVRMSLLQVICWKQGSVYSGWNAKMNEFTLGWMLVVRMNLNGEHWWIHSGLNLGARINFYSRLNAKSKDEFTLDWMIVVRMNLTGDEFWQQWWIYCGFNAESKDNFLLQIQCLEQRCIYSGLNAKRKDIFFTLGWMWKQGWIFTQCSM